MKEEQVLPQETPEQKSARELNDEISAAVAEVMITGKPVRIDVSAGQPLVIDNKGK